jgi:rare lipoprotein A
MMRFVIYCLAVLSLVGCATTGGTQYKTNLKPYTIAGKTYYPWADAKNYSETGVASWYGPKFHGRKTASGEKYNQNAMTAAHKTLPFGTKVRVKNVKNDKSVIVRINDRGPFAKGRIIDVSRAAAKKLDMINSGTAKVNIKVVD